MSMLMTPSLVKLSHVAAETFFTGLWQGLLLVATASVLLRLLPRLASSVRFAVWALTFTLSLALPFLRLPARSTASLAAAAPMSFAPLHLSQMWGTVVVALWVALALTRTSQLFLQAIHLRRLWVRAMPVTEETFSPRRLRAGRRTVELCVSTDVESPNVIGFFSPRLLIPASMFTQLSEQELDQIILHECAHLKRGDDWSNLVQKIALALFPINPAAFWLDRRLSLERELACDAAVVRSTAAPTTYARCLTRLAEHRLHCRGYALALSARGRQSELAQRVQILLSPAQNLSSLKTGASFCIFAVVLAVSSLSVAHAPQLISFAKATSALQQQASIAARLDQAPVAMPQVSIAQSHIAAIRYTKPKTAVAISAVNSFHASDGNNNISPFSPELRRLSPTRVRTVSAVTNLAQPRMMLADQTAHRKRSIRAAAAIATPAVYTVPNNFASSYAAVPFGDGWLIIQL